MTGITSKIDTTRLPSNWHSQLERQLAAGEELVAFFEPDLNGQLQFADGLVALTDRRILSLNAGKRRNFRGTEATNEGNWRTWPLDRLAELRIREASGLGVLELLSANALEATWQYTMAQSAAAHQFVQAVKSSLTIDRQVRARDQSMASAATVCPSCGARIEPPHTVCESCTPTAAPPPVRSLWRLGQFARPHALIH